MGRADPAKPLSQPRCCWPCRWGTTSSSSAKAKLRHPGSKPEGCALELDALKGLRQPKRFCDCCTSLRCHLMSRLAARGAGAGLPPAPQQPTPRYPVPVKAPGSARTQRLGSRSVGISLPVQNAARGWVAPTTEVFTCVYRRRGRRGRRSRVTAGGSQAGGPAARRRGVGPRC